MKRITLGFEDYEEDIVSGYIDGDISHDTTSAGESSSRTKIHYRESEGTLEVPLKFSAPRDCATSLA